MQNEILREAQYDLSASRDAFAALYDLAPTGVIILDLDGVICQANRAAEDMLGATQSLTGRHLFAFAAEHQRPGIIEQVVAARRGQWPTIRIDIGRRQGPTRVLRLDGRVCPAMPMADGTRRTAILLVATDVTAQVEEQEALHQARVAAESAMRAKADFLSAMSHEIRTPLNGILGMNAVLLEMGLDPHVSEMLQVIRTSGEDLLRVLNDVLDMSRLEAGKVHPERTLFDLRNLVEDIIALYAPLAYASRIEMVLAMDPALPRRAVGDAGRIRQVLQNLLGNAVKFTHQGEVRLEVAPADEGRIRFAVADTGIGMDAETVARMFKPFTQADMSISRRYGGSGLGLSISHRLVGLMGGSLACTSRPDHGTTMSFSLEIGCDAPPPGPARLRGRIVQVIDRHEGTRAALVAHLQAWGMGVRDAASIAEAKAAGWFDSEPRPLACIIDDHGLAELQAPSGHPDNRAKALILISSGAGENHLSLLESSGIHALLMRPPKPSRLEEVLVACAVGSRDEIPTTIPPPRRGWPGRRIAVVDDHPVTRLVVRRMLEQYGVLVELAGEGDEGLAMIERARPDLVLVDVRMPQCDGPSMTRMLRQNHPGWRLPVIACSATTQDGERAAAIDAGMDGWLAKPIRVGELTALLERHLGPPVDLP